MTYVRERQRKNTKKTMIIKEHGTRPFQNIAGDIFEFNGQLGTDQYTKMPFIKIMMTVTSTNYVEYFKAIFAGYFALDEFHSFTIERGEKIQYQGKSDESTLISDFN